ncbi:hypothetical protein [Agrobacterium sp. NPDC090273]|uniref:hypothetical protein n=1 Tax=Agrobacterium sp. NPDC090273 TaxID=3363919 RepID=UPI003839DDF1
MTRHLSAGLVLIVTCCVFTISTKAFIETAKFSSLSRLATAAGRSGSISDRALDRAVEKLPAIVNGNVCRSTILKAGMRLLLQDVDRKSEVQAPQEWKATLAFAEHYLRHGVTCLPQDGEFWLRLAMIRSLQVPFAEEVAALTNMSQLLAPADPDVLEARVAFWKRLSEPALSMTATARRADFALLCSRAGTGVRGKVGDVCTTGN